MIKNTNIVSFIPHNKDLNYQYKYKNVIYISLHNNSIHRYARLPLHADIYYTEQENILSLLTTIKIVLLCVPSEKDIIGHYRFGWHGLLYENYIKERSTIEI
jgi:hypothetical protein